MRWGWWVRWRSTFSSSDYTVQTFVGQNSNYVMLFLHFLPFVNIFAIFSWFEFVKIYKNVLGHYPLVEKAIRSKWSKNSTKKQKREENALARQL